MSRGVNLALAAVLTWLVFLLLTRVAGERAARFGTLLFAVHPVHVEAIAWVTGRAELLAALGGGAAFVLLLDVLRGRGGPVRAGLGGLCLLAGFLAKENAAVFLPLLLLFLPAAAEGAARSSRRLALALGSAVAAPSA
ncbi:hypothetical protein K8I85_14555, partial [bacterium]|nr:hypothetical protein [bacterium]